jgi:hypothetical protein
MHILKIGKQTSNLTIGELFFSSPSFLPPDLPGRKSTLYYRYSSDPNFGEQLKKYDLIESGAETSG